MDTLALALLLLRANTSTDSGQGRCVLKNLGSSKELTTLNVLDERWNIDVYRTALNTAWLGAVQTTLGLGHCHLLGKSDVNFLGTGGGTINGVEFRHDDTLNLCTLLGLHALLELLAPRCIAIGENFY